MVLWPGGAPLRRGRLSAAEEAEIDTALAFFDDVSASTRAGCRSSLRGWWRWCASTGRSPWPAQPDDVAAYVAELLDSGASLTGVRAGISRALGAAHRRAGLPDPTASPAVQVLLWPSGSPSKRGRLSAPEEAEIDVASAFFDDLSASTQGLYRSSLRGWWRWCASTGRSPWPAQPDDVAAYVAELLDSGASLTGVRAGISRALGAAHRRAGLPDPTASPAVQVLLWPSGSPSKRGRLSAPEEAEIDVASAFFDDLSASTQGLYRVYLRGWWRWCAGSGRSPWPAQPDDVAAHVAGLLDSGASLPGVRAGISRALGGAHRRGGLPDPTATSAVQALLRPGGSPRRWGGLSAPEEVEIDTALAFFDDVSARTRAVYRSSLRGWWRWCAGAGRTPWPAQPDDVAAYVAELLDSGTRFLGVRLRVWTMLGGAHRRAGLPDPTASPAVQALLWPGDSPTRVGASVTSRIGGGFSSRTRFM